MALKLTLWITLAYLCIGSQAYVVLVLNKSQSPLIPQVQSSGTSIDAPDSIRGYLLSGKERVYDNSDEWLNTPAMGVVEGTKRTMSVFVNNQAVPCGSVTFQTGTIVTYDGSGCTTSEMNTLNFHKVTDIMHFSWIVKDFDTGEVDSSRVYATGPTDFIWASGNPMESTITFEVVEHGTGNIQEAIAKGYRKIPPCHHKFTMNSAVGCKSGTKSDLYIDYRDEDNPNLLPGSYSGVAKIFGQKWHNAGGETVDYVNLEILGPGAKGRKLGEPCAVTLDYEP